MRQETQENIMNQKERKVYIPTLDPRGGGGVLSVTKFAYTTAKKAGFDPHIVYNTIPWDDCTTIRDILKGDIGILREQVEREGMRGTAIGRLLPEVESLNYILNHPQWRKTIDNNTAFGVGGPFFSCLPLALAKKSYYCWLGTLIEDEREVQVSEFTVPRRARYVLERPMLKQYEKITLERADRLFVQSNYTKERIHEEYGISRSSIELLPVPIDTERFKPKPDDQNEQSELELIFVGRLSDSRKNIPLLLKAFQQVLQVIPNVNLTLIGDEPSQEITNQIIDFGIEDGIKTPGYVSDVVTYLQDSDVFVLPSYQEGLGIAGLEAMSCGLPVVATECGGPEDYVINGKTGFLVSPNDANEFANRLITLLKNSELRHQLGENARSLIEERYAKSTIEHRLSKILGSLS